MQKPPTCNSFEFSGITGKTDNEASKYNEPPLMTSLLSNWDISFYETRGLLDLFRKVKPWRWIKTWIDTPHDEIWSFSLWLDGTKHVEV